MTVEYNNILKYFVFLKNLSPINPICKAVLKCAQKTPPVAPLILKIPG
jgi:hypothetical protein